MQILEYLIAALIGWLTGLLVNYLSDVLPHKRRLVYPFCLKCDSPQPPINYFIHPRYCNNCNIRRPVRTYLVEIIMILASMYLWISTHSIQGWAVSLVVLMYFCLVIVIDFEHRLIMHWVSLGGAIIGLGFGSWQHGFWNTLRGGGSGFLAMLVLYLLGYFLLRIVNRLGGKIEEDEALGFGDVNLSGVIGLMLGWPGITVGLALSILLFAGIGGVYIILMIIARRYKLGLALPFGPFIAGSAIILLFFQKTLYAFLGWG